MEFGYGLGNEKKQERRNRSLAAKGIEDRYGGAPAAGKMEIQTPDADLDNPDPENMHIEPACPLLHRAVKGDRCDQNHSC